MRKGQTCDTITGIVWFKSLYSDRTVKWRYFFIGTVGYSNVGNGNWVFEELPIKPVVLNKLRDLIAALMKPPNESG